MKKRAVIVHGWGADHTSNWFPWLAGELRQHHWEVQVPDFPHTQNPVLDEWLKHFENVAAGLVPADRKQPRGLQLLIGHSLGVPFILRYLESIDTDKKVDAAYLVAGFDQDLGIPEIYNFVDKPFNWRRIKNNCRKFVVINSDNDPYVPFKIGKTLAENLGVTLTVEPNGDHLNAPGGSLTYPRLPDLIIRLQ